jgi:hypothetical protein
VDPCRLVVVTSGDNLAPSRLNSVLRSERWDDEYASGALTSMISFRGKDKNGISADVHAIR